MVHEGTYPHSCVKLLKVSHCRFLMFIKEYNLSSSQEKNISGYLQTPAFQNQRDLTLIWGAVFIILIVVYWPINTWHFNVYNANISKNLSSTIAES